MRRCYDTLNKKTKKGDTDMPYVNVRVAGELSDDQKDEIVSQITDTLREVAGKPDESTYVVIDEVPRHNWAKGGQRLT